MTAGPYTLHGDGRTFSSDSDPSASRGYIWISVDEARSEPHMNPTGYQHVRVGPGGRSGRAVGVEIEWAEPSEENRWEVVPGEGGEITVTYDLVLGGDLEEVAPHINGTITFVPDGKGGYRAVGERDGFPWAEAYYHDGQGNVQTIFQDPAVTGNPLDLYAIEPFTSAWIHNAGKRVVDSLSRARVFKPRLARIGAE